MYGCTARLSAIFLHTHLLSFLHGPPHRRTQPSTVARLRGLAGRRIDTSTTVVDTGGKTPCKVGHVLVCEDMEWINSKVQVELPHKCSRAWKAGRMPFFAFSAVRLRRLEIMQYHDHC